MLIKSFLIVSLWLASLKYTQGQSATTTAVPTEIFNECVSFNWPNTKSQIRDHLTVKSDVVDALDSDKIKGYYLEGATALNRYRFLRKMPAPDTLPGASYTCKGYGAELIEPISLADAKSIKTTVGGTGDRMWLNIKKLDKGDKVIYASGRTLPVQWKRGESPPTFTYDENKCYQLDLKGSATPAQRIVSVDCTATLDYVCSRKLAVNEMAVEKTRVQRMNDMVGLADPIRDIIKIMEQAEKREQCVSNEAKDYNAKYNLGAPSVGMKAALTELAGSRDVLGNYEFLVNSLAGFTQDLQKMAEFRALVNDWTAMRSMANDAVCFCRARAKRRPIKTVLDNATWNIINNKIEEETDYPTMWVDLSLVSVATINMIIAVIGCIMTCQTLMSRRERQAARRRAMERGEPITAVKTTFLPGDKADVQMETQNSVAEAKEQPGDLLAVSSTSYAPINKAKNKFKKQKKTLVVQKKPKQRKKLTREDQLRMMAKQMLQDTEEGRALTNMAGNVRDSDSKKQTTSIELSSSSSEEAGLDFMLDPRAFK